MRGFLKAQLVALLIAFNLTCSSIGAPPAVSTSPADNHWATVIDEISAIARVASTWQAMFEVIPDEAWNDPKFHRALADLSASGRGWGEVASIPNSRPFLASIERNPSLLTIWYPLSRFGRRAPAWLTNQNEVTGFYQIWNGLSPAARSIHRSLLQSAIVRETETVTNFITPNDGAPKSAPPTELIHLHYCSQEEINRALSDHPQTLTRLNHALSKELRSVLMDRSGLARKFNLHNPLERLFGADAVLDSFAPKLIEAINAGESEPTLREMLWRANSERFLQRHAREIRKDHPLIQELYEKGYLDAPSPEIHRKIIEAIEQRTLAQLPSGEQLHQQNSKNLISLFYSTVIRAHGAGILEKFSDSAISKIVAYASEHDMDLSQALTEVLSMRPALARRLFRSSPGVVTYLPQEKRGKRIVSLRQPIISRDLIIAPNASAFQRGVAAAFDGNTELPLNPDVMSFSTTPNANPNGDMREIYEDFAIVANAARNADSSLRQRGVALDPLFEPLRNLEDLLLQPPPNKFEGPLTEQEIAFKINEERMNRFGTTTIEPTDELMVWEDRQIRSSAAMSEGPSRRGKPVEINPREEARQQHLMEQSLNAWARTTRTKVLQNLRATLMHAERSLNNYGYKIFDSPWHHLSSGEFNRWLLSDQLGNAMLDFRGLGLMRKILFMRPGQAVSVQSMMETQLLLSTMKENVRIARRTLQFLDTLDLFRVTGEGALNGFRSLRNLNLQTVESNVKDGLLSMHQPFLLKQIIEQNNSGFWHHRLDEARSKVRKERAETARAALSKTMRRDVKIVGGATGLISGLIVAGVALMLHSESPNHDERFRAGERAPISGNGQGGQGSPQENASQSARQTGYPRTHSSTVPSRDNEQGSSASSPHTPAPFDGHVGNPDHNVSPPNGDVMPSFAVGGIGAHDSPIAFHFGEHREFSDEQSEKITLTPRARGATAYVATHETAPTILDQNGLGMMPAPDDTRLVGFEAAGVTAQGVVKQLSSDDFAVLRNQRWGDYAVKVFDPNITAIQYRAEYRNIPHDSSGENTLIPAAQLRGISYRLNEVGFSPLAERFEHIFEGHPQGITFGELAHIVSEEGVYSHRTDHAPPVRTTRLEIETNPLFRFSRFRNESGRFAGTCGSYARFTNGMVDLAYDNVGQSVTEIRPTILDANQDGFLSLANELHGRSGISLPGHRSFIIDSTSGTRDSVEETPRTDPLPGGDPVSQKARYVDFRNLVLYAFMGGRQRRREFFEWGRKQEEILMREGVNVEELPEELREKAGEVVQVSSEDSSAVAQQSEGLPAVSSHAEALRKQLEERELQEIRQKSNAAYELIAGISNNRRELIKRQTELRASSALSKSSESPAAFALSLDRSFRAFLNGDMSVEQFNKNVGLDFSLQNERPTTQEWRRLLDRLITVSQKQTKNLQRFRDDVLPQFLDGRVKRQNLTAADQFLVTNFRDPLYLEATITVFEGLRQLAQNLGPNHLMAITERRLRLNDEHREIWGPIGVTALNGASPVTWKENRLECLTRNLEQVYKDGS